MNYYNEFDPGAAEWIRELINDNLIPKGIVDERSIKEVPATDLRGRLQCHFFAGIAGWSEALRLAGWPEDREVWTGSCPCQPYSAAGKQKGNADERNLWPDFFRLIRECRPVTVFGEQVQGAIKHGWLDRVHRDLEGIGYAVGATVLTAAGVGAPHIRQRLYWVAHAKRSQRRADGERDKEARGREQEAIELRGSGFSRGLADAEGSRGRADHRPIPSGTTPGVRSEEGQDGGRSRERARRLGDSGTTDGMEHPASNGRGERGTEPERGSVASKCGVDGVGDSNIAGLEEQGCERQRGSGIALRNGFWTDSQTILCRDGKSRRVPTQPGLFPLASGVPGRVGLLRGAGNAICVPTAAAFIKAFLEVQG